MEDWTDLARQARDAHDAWTSPATARLYLLAHALGPSVLASFRLSDADVEELVSGFFAAKLDYILGARVPREYFCAALRKRAISWKRRKSTEVVGDRPAEAAHESQVASAEKQVEAALRLPLVRRELTPREWEVLSAIGEQVDRDELAEALGTSRANIDQIASRARSKLRKAGVL